MDDLRLYMVTWNVATRQPDQELDNLLGFANLKGNGTLPDIFIIGLQEVKSQPQNMVLDAIFDDPWTNAFREVLALRDYIKVKTIRLQGTILSLFCLRKHLLHLRDIETQYTKTGFGGIWGNKGAVSIRLSIYGCSVCFVNCHFTPHDQFLQERIADYNNVIRTQKFQANETSNILYHDYVFWIGDINFRLLNGLAAEEIDRLIKKKDLTTLLAQDQLRHVMERGEAFSELVEQLPSFPPTYKFEFYTSRYDLKRRPSWTDRILYRVNANVYENLTLQAEQLSYKSIDSYIQSDHKPVVGEFIIKVFSNYYERAVEFSPIQTWYIDEENSATFKLPGDVQTSLWDWVGLFKEAFTSLDDYLCYMYVRGTSPSVNGSTNHHPNTKTVVFPDTAVRIPGPYRLLYFSNNSGSVLGMSDSFNVVPRPGTTVSQVAYSDGFQ